MKLTKIVVIALGFVLCCSLASANVKQKKIYQKAFPGSKAKCIECHTNKIPKKKDISTHELNAYGLAAQAAAETPTVETYQAIGVAEDFVAGEGEAVVEEVQEKAVEKAADQAAEAVEKAMEKKETKGSDKE